MTVEEVNNGVEKRIILVGIRFDGHTRELLDWALVKVADTGDHVIAVHVCRNSDSTSKNQPLLDSYLADYEGLCDQKQVDLTGHLVRGNSIRKVLVREAKNYAAAAVILGISSHKAFGGWLSIAKYCTKRLPLTTEVIAIHHGKVVFKSSSNPQQPGVMGDPRPSYYAIGNSIAKDSVSEFGESEVSEMGRLSYDGVHSVKDEDTMSPFEMRQKALSSVSVFKEDFTQQRPGWPLLRAASSLSPPALEARKMSVVKWVMNLPNRSLPETPQSSNSGDSPKTEEDSLGSGRSDFTNKSNRNGTTSKSEILELLLKTNSSGCQWISHDVLKTSTCNFSSDNLIGKGGCNRVYKGLLPDGKTVAVKILKSSKEAWKDYITEIDIMTSLDHKNITPLLGICVEDNYLISVYDFMSRGNLEENLRGNNKDESILSWEVRFNVAVEIAEALNYLHNGCPRPVIHRDIKSSNILLSNEFEPQLSDFGLAIWGPTTSSSLTHADVVGTFGYLAPEYFMYGKVSEKIDVYSFGVVLLELLTGKGPISSETTKGQESLVMWAKPKLEKGDLASILDPNLDEDIHKDQMVRMVLAATCSLTQSARLRPKMSQILKILRGERVEEEEEIVNELEDQFDSENLDNDDEVYPESSAKSHLSLAFLDVDDKSTSFSSVDKNSNLSFEEYLKGRWSRSLSLD